MGVPYRVTGVLAGRERELAMVRGVIRDASGGRARALMVSGEAGVGKTRLLADACTTVDDQLDVVWCACAPMSASSVPYGAIRAALRAWHGDAVVVDGPDDLDAMITDAARDTPVALVVDDLQWADQGTLDALAFVAAGLAHQRLVMLLTCRSSDVTADSRVRRWLADVRRLPRVDELSLDRLDRAGTADQIADLIGASPVDSLVDEVWGRTAGNAYFTELLVAGLDPHAARPPEEAPEALRDAVAASWFDLSPPARRVTQLVAAGRRPIERTLLDDVGTRMAVDAGALDEGVHEAMGRRIVIAGAGDTVALWHPLLSEVLLGDLPRRDRWRIHAAYAAALADLPPGRDVDAESARIIELASHLEESGDPRGAFDAYRTAADMARRHHGPVEETRLLRRAVALESAGPRGDRSLRLRLGAVAFAAGEIEAALDVLDETLAGVDAATQPLLASELLLRQALLHHVSGRAFAPLALCRQAVRLARVRKSSREYARAAIWLAWAEQWHERPRPHVRRRRVRRAMARARAEGDADLAAQAHLVRGMLRLEEGDPRDRRDAAVALRLAIRVGDPWLVGAASIWGSNARLARGGVSEAAEVLGSAADWLDGMDARQWLGFVSASRAMLLIDLGRWRDCQEIVRRMVSGVTLGSAAAASRLSAARLACRRGDLDEAELHLRRVDELLASPEAYRGLEVEAVRAEVTLARDAPESALDIVADALTRHGTDPQWAVELLTIGVSAAADVVASSGGRDRDRRPRLSLARIDAVSARAVPVDLHAWSQANAFNAALFSELSAERARFHRSDHEAGLWARARQAWTDVGFSWHAARAASRYARVLLTRRTDRAAAAEALRWAHDVAAELGAAPLLADVVDLARAARVRLDVPAPASRNALPHPFDRLTAREREVLGHLRAGRTYAEIATSLVISEKTVSAHVSNILRKSGTASRVEAAQLASRVEA